MRLVSRSLLAALCMSGPALVPTCGARAAQPDALVYVDQGREWPNSRADFYTRDQGSQMIPLAWLQALKQPDGHAFLEDSLARYGYLPNPSPTNPSGLPIGFTAVESSQGPMAGMTCAACHTRQITVSGTAYRIDGGPTLADFEPFLADLDKAVLAVLVDDASFKPFADAVLKQKATPTTIAVLRAEVTLWSVRYHTLISNSLPTDRPWGPSRLDAVSMIFNRLTGLDLGPSPTYLLPDNIKRADAPTRYPFLWNAPRQDFTQWPGFAENGNDLLGLARNLGEVYGVFGTFHPQPTSGPSFLANRNYLAENSANFDGLDKLETLIKQIKPPVWPWGTNATLVQQGKAIYERANANDGTGGCAGCHGKKWGELRLPTIFTWKTPIQDVGTDRAEWKVVVREADSGSMKGAWIFKIVPAIQPRSLDITLLKASVAGAILEYEISSLAADFDLQARLGMTTSTTVASRTPAPGGEMLGAPAPTIAAAAAAPFSVSPLDQLDGAFRLPGMRAQSLSPTTTEDSKENVYESRVLEGIWAAAPYLHNGSVPTLADLLKPASLRPKAFKVGPAYDTASVGLAAEQPGTRFTLHATGCDDLYSGDSNCGHEYGTNLPDGDKKALLEYLKSL